MSYQRIDRISEEVRREVDAIIREEVNDPRVSGTFSVTRAEVTRDLRYANLRSALAEDGFAMTEVPFRPTAEHFAEYFYQRMTACGYTVAEATVYETPNNCASYTGEEQA